MLLLVLLLLPAVLFGGGYSLRFYGNGHDDIDRVKIRLDQPHRNANIGQSDFTIEWWMKATPGENTASSCVSGGNWIIGNTFLDRDVFGNGDFGDYGMSLRNGRLAFGVQGPNLQSLDFCGTKNVADGFWHHVALQRAGSVYRIFIDGILEMDRLGPAGDISYREGRTGGQINDPYLVIGAEKHDYTTDFPSFKGWIDELRISNIARYGGGFARPSAPFISDANTMALYHFDEGGGPTAWDLSSVQGIRSDGVIRYGGTPFGPKWSVDTPFTGCNYTLSLEGAVVVAAENRFDLDVTATPASCAWTLVSTSTWLIPLSPVSGQGNARLEFFVAQNTTAQPRAGAIRMQGLSFPVLQKASIATSPFTDVPIDHPVVDYIKLLSQTSVTKGCDATRFCPNDSTTRGQMAVFLVRALQGSDNFPYPTTPYFTDVSPSDFYFSHVQRMRQLGITSGCTPTLFCPLEAVTRAEMAALMIHALYEKAGMTQAAYFTDQPPANVFFPFVQQMRDLGITAGCTAGTYCPSTPVTRWQMATFLIRAFFTP